MTAHTASNAPVTSGPKAERITPLALVRFALVVLLQPLILFGAAGRLDWLMGWIYLGLFIFLSLGSRILVQRKNPDLIAERAGAMDRRDIPPADKALVSLIAIYGPMAGLLVAGLDHRFGWTPPLPPAVPWIALVLATGGVLLGTWRRGRLPVHPVCLERAVGADPLRVHHPRLFRPDDARRPRAAGRIGRLRGVRPTRPVPLAAWNLVAQETDAIFEIASASCSQWRLP
jgi:hypothetical protein